MGSAAQLEQTLWKATLSGSRSARQEGSRRGAALSQRATSQKSADAPMLCLCRNFWPARPKTVTDATWPYCNGEMAVHVRRHDWDQYSVDPSASGTRQSKCSLIRSLQVWSAARRVCSFTTMPRRVSTAPSILSALRSHCPTPSPRVRSVLRRATILHSRATVQIAGLPADT